MTNFKQSTQTDDNLLVTTHDKVKLQVSGMISEEKKREKLEALLT